MSIHKRIVEFAEKRYGSVGKLQKKVEEISGKTQDMFRFTNGVKPSTVMLLYLQEAGCNINWLLTGAVYNKGEYPEYDPGGETIIGLKNEIEIQKRVQDNQNK
ncbi:MAG TPA: hypothetical protein DCS19_10660, partial [Flavobacterium sp.]|nr:hypothetical protein [Flavobacterium sp.]